MLSEQLSRARRFYRTYGAAGFVRRAATLVMRKDAYKNYVREAKGKTARDVFSGIYDNKLWGASESLSGRGSLMEATGEIRSRLPEIFAKYNVRTFLDAPCGDLNWMHHIIPADMQYVGMDVVPSLIAENKIKYAGPNRTFVAGDITADPLPAADMMLCRDCLFHLSFDDARALLANFYQSGIPLLMANSHDNANNAFRNSDITTGGFRVIDLFTAPYNLPRDPIEQFPDYMRPDPERTMYVWTREQVGRAQGLIGPGDGAAAHGG